MLNVTWPFVSFMASEEALKVTCFASTFEFPKRTIRRLKRHKGFISIGLKIEHDNPNYASFLVFWPSSSIFYGTSEFPEFKRELEKLGYDIEE